MSLSNLSMTEYSALPPIERFGIPSMTATRTMWIDFLTEEVKLMYDSRLNLDPDDSGFDLYIPKDIVVSPFSFLKVGLGIRLMMTRGKDPSSNREPMAIYARSSLYKYGLMLANSVGVIDRSYCGEIGAVLYNGTDREVVVEGGTRLLQVCAPDLQPFFVSTITLSADATERGEGGFGSTGEK